MLKKMKLKCLFLKFGFSTLEATCKAKGWKIPTVKEVKDYPEEILHEWIWVIDEPRYDNEDGTRGVLYNKTLDKTVQVNKKFMENACILKEI